jgi:hypothetical protein
VVELGLVEVEVEAWSELAAVDDGLVPNVSVSSAAGVVIGGGAVKLDVGPKELGPLSAAIPVMAVQVQASATSTPALTPIRGV